jgi:aspartyl-tRNA synthetase
VRGIKIEGGADKFSRRDIDALGELVKTYRAKGLAWIKYAEGAQASFAKFVSVECVERIGEIMGAEVGDIVFIVADGVNRIVFDSLGALRCECARRMGVIDRDKFNFLWVTDFPLYEYSEEEGRFVAMHHPFTAPADEDIDKLESDTANVRAKAYDMVLNGYELGGGSIRIHSSELQARMFKVLGFTEEQIARRFGHMIEAFKYGAPPHGGLAFGLDRIVMLMAGRDNLRDVIAFPKVQNASELMTGAPDVVDKKQLDELGISLCRGE